MSGLNALIDNYFENGLKRTRTSHNDDHPITGLILIWPHEQANLGKLEESSLSKGVFFLHKRSNDDSFNFSAAKDKILEYAKTSSAFFRFYLKEPNWNEIKSLQREKIVIYNEVLSKKIDTEDVSKTSRILENYALVHASTMVLLKENDFHLGVGIEELDEQITESYLEEYIPAIVKIKAKKGHYSKEEKPSADYGMSLEDMEAQLVQVIDDLSLKDMMTKITFPRHEGEPALGFQVTAWKSRFSKLFESCKTSTAYFVHRTADKNWFLRETFGPKEGKYAKLKAYIIKNKDCPKLLFSVILNKIQPELPNVVLSSEGNVDLKSLLDKKLKDAKSLEEGEPPENAEHQDEALADAKSLEEGEPPQIAEHQDKTLADAQPKPMLMENDDVPSTSLLPSANVNDGNVKGKDRKIACVEPRKTKREKRAPKKLDM